ncbi:DUF4065 domain-containing protein [Rhodomicrobium vannielii ATCC 17100]|uniref:Panacea domain-containing protein n=1 Tax=Rhodomicrobium vannielii TaxID=1069 RepID=UPI00191A4941|nr:type II toxin-antitoxin system antitoxin SocA domain-containing protein [Rhodomicrobium vannielii]MBJ7533779.1 DUF4065 domain-containing protein [Rhodomicrobium vannielii ATCC 17100]
MEKPCCDPSTLAKWFINNTDRDSGDVITHLKLQKLVYYAQAWHLANFNRPIFDEDMQAWTHGPVVPSLWKEYKDKGWDAIPPEPKFNLKNKRLNEFLMEINRKYGYYSAKKLEHLTHREDPWKQTRGNIPLEAKCTNPIDKILIRDYYAARIGKTWR